MNWETLLTGGVGAGLVMGVIKLFELYASRNKTQSEAVLNIAQSASEIVEGGDKAVEAMKKVLTVYEVRDEQKTKRIDEQDTQISNLKAQMTSMQIDERAKEERLATEISALKQWNKVLVDILREHNIEVPPRPDILKESDPKIKAMK